MVLLSFGSEIDSRLKFEIIPRYSNSVAVFFVLLCLQKNYFCYLS